MKVWLRSTQALWWKHRKRMYFDYVCTQPPMQMSHNISGIKAHKILTRRRRINGGVNATIHVVVVERQCTE